MSQLAFLVPVLNRPQHVGPLLRSIYETTPTAHVVFVADPDDAPEISEIEVHQGCLEAVHGDLTISLLIHAGGYAEKINHAVSETTEPYVFLGADDLRPLNGWFGAAKDRIDNGFGCVGINDLLPRRRVHTTHFLLSREYAEQPTADGGRGPLCETYTHNFVDDELIATAQNRGQYHYENLAKVHHLHPQGMSAPDDATYQKGRKSYHADRATFAVRAALWT